MKNVYKKLCAILLVISIKLNILVLRRKLETAYQPLRIMLYGMMMFILIEVLLIWHHFDWIVLKLSSNWWVTAVGFMTWRFALTLVGRIIIKGIMAVFTGLFIDFILKLFISQKQMSTFKSVVAEKTAYAKENIQIRWSRYNTIEIIIILIGAIQAALLLAGIILYVPQAKRKAIGMGQKKTGAKILFRFFTLRVFQVPIAWFISWKIVMWMKNHHIVIKIRDRLEK